MLILFIKFGIKFEFHNNIIKYEVKDGKFQFIRIIIIITIAIWN